MFGVSKWSLGHDAIEAIARAKTDWRKGRLKAYRGLEIIDPHIGVRGARSFESDVGEDRFGGRGSRRLVLKEQSGQITEMYFSDNHFKPGSWVRIVDF